MAQNTNQAERSQAEATPDQHHSGKHARLGWFLCWAVVFADIGTSVYYVPGILYGQVGLRAGLFVFLTTIAFLLLTLKYAEVSVRFPEGGGVVTVAGQAFNPWFGAVGGMFILVDYFLTSALSSLSGVLYLDTLIPVKFSDKWLTLPIVLPAITSFTLVMFVVRALWTFIRLPSRVSSYGFVVTALALAGFCLNLVDGGDALTKRTKLYVMLFLLLALAVLSTVSLVRIYLRRRARRGSLDGAREDETEGDRAGILLGAMASLVVSILGIVGIYLDRSTNPVFGLVIASTSLAAAAVLWAAGWLYDYEHGPHALGKIKRQRVPGIGTLATILATASLVFTALLVLFSLGNGMPGSPFVIAVITVVIICVLGWLNWRGIKESANVSAIAAVAALLSDIVILLVILIRVPLPTIGAIFQAMFSGKGLGGLTLLTGFAGAFLAFSGLESISQLSPVMRVPRRKTVSAALALVFITVGVTSPLLTMFSTVLLTNPQFQHTIAFPVYGGAHTDPNSFISELAGAYGGPILSVATAITAATLLIFACNTAIIGAYHVFVALSRMRFFPRVVERTNDFGTPYISIILAMGIPILVLLVAGGSVNLLGDLYAFGLLGAFSLTCLSLDVIRTRERRGGSHVGAEVDPELLGAPGLVNAPTPALPTRLQRLSYTLVPEAARNILRRPQARLVDWLHRIAGQLQGPASAFTYYIGFLTTAVVMVAWVTNLYFKPLATYFGGGLTLLGVAISVAHYQYQLRRGEPVVFPDMPVLMPESWLVVLSPVENNSRAVIRAAVQSASGHPLAFLYLAPKPPDQEPPRLLEIRDRYGHDNRAQKILSIAKQDCTAQKIPAKYFYAVGGAKQVFDIARRVRPDEIVAEEQTAKRITRAARGEDNFAISPEYVRYQPVDGITIAHYVLPALYTQVTVRRANATTTGGGRALPHLLGGARTPGREDSSREDSSRLKERESERRAGAPRSPGRDTSETETAGTTDKPASNGADLAPKPPDPSSMPRD